MAYLFRNYVRVVAYPRDLRSASFHGIRDFVHRSNAIKPVQL